jgi:AraC-like DNA-binding protein
MPFMTGRGGRLFVADRYFSSRVRRLYRDKRWSMAEFSRRTGLGRSILQRILDTTGYCHCTVAQREQLAVAFNVTQEYLCTGHAPGEGATPPGALSTAMEISRLREENDRLRRRRGDIITNMDRTVERASQTSLLAYADREKLEVRRRDGKVVLVQDGEFEIAEAPTLKAALQVALQYSTDQRD